ncbi:MAG: glycine C-acetyltransferase [Deltaproteobacteria bacterium CG_4_10_14_0_2_um_filter_43_8]|nr:MAG: glycine C-acetyltransferase [Deltaproteobacteria bacterium CG11_big_fil_rev_8_21_14_0_20_42_23]PJA21100.1 MAG: glycine C-acetyltransferase [Deltaproteobacteria bacterium CG_4_10_14_0_2_um_filter_43_8]PJC63373.1 MAG: glycine C-acetyltransferase [Deltaproteobacteria bacterium CG_4_9_14_0_2_um_filter_42_21]
MYQDLQKKLKQELVSIEEAALWKEEWAIYSSQSAVIRAQQGDVINFCANNYLGLANHPQLIAAAKKALDEFGYGTASVRFICGTFSVHEDLEQAITTFMGTEDTILYSSCYEANEGLFETILGEHDAIISDSLNHASIIDGVRLCKAKRYRYENSNMQELETALQKADEEKAVLKLIATDGVFSMDGYIAKLDEICALAKKYNAIVMVDDSHATGFVGKEGRGSPEYCKVMDQVDIITSTLGKALGGAAGGFTTGKKELIQFLRQRSRPYLFSNALPPMIAAATLVALDLIFNSNELRVKLNENTKYFRSGLKQAGLDLLEGEHPIVPVMFYDAKKANDVAKAMLAKGVYVKGFSFPVVPKGKARIRCQVSAAHTREQLDKTIDAFSSVVTKK